MKNEVLSIIFEIFGRNGDAIAKQYAGSEAFHKAQLYKINGDWVNVKHNITFIAVKRYFHNILIDKEKQKSFYLFLGLFVPDEKNLDMNLWDNYEKVRVLPCKCVVVDKVFEVFGRICYKKKILEENFFLRKIKKLDFNDLPIFIEEEENEILEILEKKENLEKKVILEKKKVLEVYDGNYHFEKDFRDLEKKTENFEFFLSYINKTSFF